MTSFSFINFYLVSYLSALGLNCSMRGLHYSTCDLSWRCAGFSRCSLWMPEWRVSVFAALRLTSPAVCGVIAPSQGLDPCPLHRKVDSQLLDHHDVNSGFPSPVSPFPSLLFTRSLFSRPYSSMGSLFLAPVRLPAAPRPPTYFSPDFQGKEKNLLPIKVIWNQVSLAWVGLSSHETLIG